MRIAVCLSGQLRTWKDAQKSWDAFFNELKTSPEIDGDDIEVDYFVHTWDFNSTPFAVWTKQQWDAGKFHTGFEQPPAEGVSKEEIEEFLQTIKPKRHLIENIFKSTSRKEELDARTQWRLGDYTKWAPISWAGAQLYGIMRAAELKRNYEFENGFEYDMVVRMRSDLSFDYLNRMIFTNDFEKPKERTLYSVHSFNTEYFPHDAIGDIFFYSDSFTYDIVSNVYNYLPQLSPDIFPFDVKVESILAYVIRMFDIKNVRLKIDPDIIRGTIEANPNINKSII